MPPKHHMASLSVHELRQLLDKVAINELKDELPETLVRNWFLIPLIWEVIVARELMAELGVSNMLQDAMAEQEPYQNAPDVLKDKLQ